MEVYYFAIKILHNESMISIVLNLDVLKLHCKSVALVHVLTGTWGIMVPVIW